MFTEKDIQRKIYEIQRSYTALTGMYIPLDIQTYLMLREQAVKELGSGIGMDSGYRMPENTYVSGPSAIPSVAASPFRGETPERAAGPSLSHISEGRQKQAEVQENVPERKLSGFERLRAMKVVPFDEKS